MSLYQGFISAAKTTADAFLVCCKFMYCLLSCRSCWVIRRTTDQAVEPESGVHKLNKRIAFVVDRSAKDTPPDPEWFSGGLNSLAQQTYVYCRIPKR